MRAESATTHDDICIGRHRDSAASVEANARANQSKSAVRAEIFRIAESLGVFTSKDIAERLGKPINTISGRITELKMLGYFRETELRRDGCALLKFVRDAQPSLF